LPSTIGSVVPRLRPTLLLLSVLMLAVALVPRGGATSSAVAADPARIELRQVLDAPLRATGAVRGACHTRARNGAGVATRSVTVSGAGPVEARLRAASGDWDLAIFDAAGRTVAASAGADATELASGWAWSAGTLRVQACRRSGGASRARVSVEHGTIPAALAARVAGQKVKVASVETPTRAAKDRLVALGLDMTEHGGRESLGVVLHGDGDVQRLREAGFRFRVLEDDMVARGLREGRVNRRYAARTARSALPSGRTVYRTLADYESEMKTLAEENPGLVRLITLPEKSWLGRDVYGIEIATDVNLNDGRPAFMNLGLHHAREWPSGEHAMEWAHELINGYKAGDERTTNVVRQSRNIVVPVVNVDGFNASRTAGALSGGDGGRDESIDDTALIVAGTFNGGEYRRKNCRLYEEEAANCATSAGLAENGTDPNRNYGGLWGGPGADTVPATQTYRGPGPFSEPDTRNIQWLISRNQVMSLVTNHTTAGLVLRAPGLRALGDPVDEDRGYKALGDAMAKENGYFSQKSFELYDTTGTTEDWSYNATGGFGFTFEIYCGDPNYETGDCDDPAFHPLFETMVKEWDGTSDQANHVNDPGHSADAPFGMEAGYDGRGNREAYYIAAESAINERRHSVIEGLAVPGATLRLTKDFQTATYPQLQEDESRVPILFDDHLETVYDVPASGAFRWHVNPSTRPIVAKDRGRAATGTPSPPEEFSQSAPITVTCTPLLIGSPCNDDQTFTVPSGPGIDNGKVTIRIQWATQASDYDLKIFRPGASPTAQDPLYSSQQRATDFEEVVIPEPEGEYLIRVANVAGVEPWEGTRVYEGPDPFQPGITETWTLTCEVGGRVLHTGQVLIDRGQVQQPDLGACDRRPRAAPPVAPPPAPPDAPPAACTPLRGFGSTGARARGGRVALRFARLVRQPVAVDVFKLTVGRRVSRGLVVARYRGRARSFTWNGRANRPRRRVTDGFYFVRFRMRLPGGGLDARRIALQRVRGRFHPRPVFHHRETCGLVRWFRLSRPVFGGRTNRAMSLAYRLNAPAQVSVTVRRGSRVVRRFRARAGVPFRTYRLQVGARGLRRGDYVATLVARRAGEVVRKRVTSFRL
jgi:Zinc carboxypeptidase